VATVVGVLCALAVELVRVLCGLGLLRFYTCHASCGGFRVRASAHRNRGLPPAHVSKWQNYLGGSHLHRRSSFMWRGRCAAVHHTRNGGRLRDANAFGLGYGISMKVYLPSFLLFLLLYTHAHTFAPPRECHFCSPRRTTVRATVRVDIWCDGSPHGDPQRWRHWPDHCEHTQYRVEHFEVDTAPKLRT
jgi:hypothetical protein